MSNEPSAGRAPPPRPRAPPALPPRLAGRRAPPSSTPRRSLLARSGDFLMSLLGGDDPSAAYVEQPTTTPPVPAPRRCEFLERAQFRRARRPSPCLRRQGVAVAPALPHGARAAPPTRWRSDPIMRTRGQRTRDRRHRERDSERN